MQKNSIVFKAEDSKDRSVLTQQSENKTAFPNKHIFHSNIVIRIQKHGLTQSYKRKEKKNKKS